MKSFEAIDGPCGTFKSEMNSCLYIYKARALLFASYCVLFAPIGTPHDVILVTRPVFVGRQI